jgi:hypothetical protein
MKEMLRSQGMKYLGPLKDLVPQTPKASSRNPKEALRNQKSLTETNQQGSLYFLSVKSAFYS